MVVNELAGDSRNTYQWTLLKTDYVISNPFFPFFSSSSSALWYAIRFTALHSVLPPRLLRLPYFKG